MVQRLTASRTRATNPRATSRQRRNSVPRGCQVPDTPTHFDAELPVGGGDLLGALDLFGFAQAIGSVFARVGPGGAAKRCYGLGAEWARIAVDRSTVEPSPRDWRFKNRAWEDHPFYRRLCRSYLAWAEAIMGLVDDAGLDWRTDERARFVVNNLTAALAPTNLFPLNPDAWERAFETAGRSVLRGWRNICRDIVENRGRPRTVETRCVRTGPYPRGNAGCSGLPERGVRAHPIRADDRCGVGDPCRRGATANQQVLRHGPVARAGASWSMRSGEDSRSTP